MKKRALSVLLAIALLGGMLPVGILTAGAYSHSDIPYAVEGGNIYFDTATGTVTDCDDSVTAANIPAEIDGVAVTSIGDHAFSHCYSLTSVTIPDSVTSIGRFAFSYCNSLTSAAIPDGVTSIGDYAFAFCDSLMSVTIPDGVTSIESSIFKNCYSLTSVTIPDGVTSIKYSAFCNCDGLTSITIPDSVTSIGDEAFSDCDGLTSVVIPDGVTSIGNIAFSDCDSLTNITIPDSVTAIGERALAYCDSLTDIWIGEANKRYSIDENGVLFNKDKTNLIQCPGGYNGSYTIPDSVTLINQEAFSECNNLTSVTIGNGVTSIAAWAFAHCHNLASVTIPNGVTHIDLYAFSYCSSLTSVTIPDSVTYIGYSAFCGCSSLSAVFFLGDAPFLGPHAFDVCDVETDTDQPIPGLTLYYPVWSEGWTTPTWNGYPTVLWYPDGFDDVPEDAWYASAVEYAVDNSLFNGMSENTFEPNTAMTRAMLVTVLWRYEGQPKVGTNSFADVPDGQWYTDAVAWAAYINIVGGVGDNRFDPNGNITREQMATILYRYASGKNIDISARADLSGFPDAQNVSSYAKDPICWAVAEGLINGSDGKLMPQGNATRAQVATILMRFIENLIKD